MRVLKLSGRKSSNLIIKGQGIYVFDYVKEPDTTDTDITEHDKSKAKFKFETLDELGEQDGLEVFFTTDSVRVVRISNQKEYLDPANKSGLSKFSGAYYWFSLDAQNQMFYAGVGEARIETVIYQYKFVFDSDEPGQKERELNKNFLESICVCNSGNTNSIKLIKDPVTQQVPLKVIDSDNVTMEMLSQNDFMLVSNLPLTSQKLYYSISGSKIVIDDNDFPQFSQAIEHSIRTPGLWCYEKLKAKSTEFNKDKPNEYETYLRITLGQNNGESPGIPYVMEIWPPNHYSPVHSHAGAEAIIRVLYGSIHVDLYPFLCGKTEDLTQSTGLTGITGIKPFGQEDFDTNEFAWVSPGLNQTHQLTNKNPNITCITLNCYLYGESNSVHYDYFDYVDSDGIIKHYEPDSDMDFISFKKLMKLEWYEQSKKRNSRKYIKFNNTKI
jgi:hypothetical protein